MSELLRSRSKNNIHRTPSTAHGIFLQGLVFHLRYPNTGLRL